MGERGVIIFGIAAGLPYYVGLALTSFDGRAPPLAPPGRSPRCPDARRLLGAGAWQAYTLTILFGALSTLVFPACAITSLHSF